MKHILTIILTLSLFACNQQADNTNSSQNHIDSLKNKPTNTYKPGFGELMSTIQVHHAKLWFAGQNKNWKLTNFEIHEINEALEDIHKYQTERKESKMIGMINPALDSVNNAIQQKSFGLFKSAYTLLTNTCNDCHRVTEHEFIGIKIPNSTTFSNQDFKPVK